MTPISTGSLGYTAIQAMEALGPMSSLRLPSTSGLRNSSQNLELAKSSKKFTSIHGLQWRRSKVKQGSVQAVLMEPTNLNESSQFGGNGSSSSNSKAAMSMAVNSAASSVLQQSSGSVEEALTSHTAKLKKARSFSHDKEKMRRDLIPLHHFRQGGFAENSLMYRQIFVIRSYEVGPDKSTSVREIFSLFQEMALNHVQLLGIAGDGFGATRAMNRLGLIWVVTKMQVDVERYPVWPEVIEIDSWVASAGKNGMRRDWIMRSYKTGEVLARATSTWCMMNGTTRRLSKIPDEVRSEIEPNFMDHRFAFSQDDSPVAPRITKLDDVSTEHRSSHLKSTPTDLDMNQHVNNLKYINWVLESIPDEHIQTHKLASIVLEYRRECHSTDIVESLTSSKTVINGDETVISDSNDWCESGETPSRCCEYSHLLRTQDAGQEILRGKTTWRARSNGDSFNSTS
ncbi:hypothetical protein KC19_3G076900 [Ceratodon purpureus]|uniref:Acyl-[acyl-carrier-protein] hydrolase n=1 Tax=Ceratodon purpureus TaxID=3225 RepID=A0A8T0IJF2_CERPU|nr:hypothetical protein KC19_3G076900 [Ceratodon purpureus]